MPSDDIAKAVIRSHLTALNLLNNSLSENAISSLSDEIIRITGRNTNELMLLLTDCIKNPESEKNLFKKIRAYLNERRKELAKTHDAFIEHHVKSNFEDYALLIGYIDTDLKLPSDGKHQLYDKKILYIEDKKLKSLFPLAKAVLFETLSDAPDNVEKLVSDYLQLKIGGEGFLLEFYILHSIKKRMESQDELAFRCKHIKSKEVAIKKFRIEACVDITGVPTEKPTKTTLYIPLSKFYPHVDCLIYDYHKDELYPIQITITQKNHKDSYHNWKKGAEATWLKIFDNTRVNFIWLVGHPKKYTRKDQNYWVVTFKSLPERNPNSFKQFQQNDVKLKEKLAKIDAHAIEEEEHGEGEPEDDSEVF